MYDTVLVQDRRGVGIVTLNRPQRMNAWTRTLGLEVRHAIGQLDAREDIHCIVVTGAGRAFCAGADLEASSSHSPEQQAAEQALLAEKFRPPTDRPYWQLRTPIIAAMNGSAVGVGMTFPLQLDLRIVAENAKYGFVFTRRGLVPELGASWSLSRLLGSGKALDILLTGRIFSGTEAVSLGFASEVCAPERVLERSLEIADDIAANVSPSAAAITKRLVYEFLDVPDRAYAENLEEQLYAWATDHEDSSEGISAFLEKRSPEWKLQKNADFPEGEFAK